MRKILFLFSLSILSISVWSQDTIIVDQIVARVGDEIVLQSDLETSYYQWLASGNSATRNAKCKVFEDLLVQSLLVNQAKIDSIMVTDSELDMQVESRVNMFAQQMGGVEELEKYLNKTIFDIKKDMKRALKDQLIADKERNFILEDVTVTPSEVAEYYKQIPADSLPLVDVSYEIRQIVFNPILTEDQEQITIDKIIEIRDKIINGQRQFASMARMYSEDPGSAKQGGELGFVSRAELDPDFAAVAFSLQPGEVSEIVKSQFGYHIIQLIERRGERVNVRHILIRQIIPSDAEQTTIKYADSIKTLILADSISFKDAAKFYSDDKNTKNNGGLMYNAATESANYKIDDLPSNVKYDVVDMNQGQISAPIITTDNGGNTVIKLYKIEKKIPAHVANLTDDYQLIQAMALAYKKNKVFKEWIEEQQNNVYINIHKDYRDCSFNFKNWVK